MIRFDIHTHAFHPKIREKATAQLYNHYHIPLAGNGDPEELAQRISLAGLDKAVIHSVATAAEQVIPANDWAIHLQKQYKSLLAFGSLHVDFPDWQQEINRLAENNISGLKFHADFQNVHVDDKRWWPFFEEISDKFVLMFHVGDKLDPITNPSSPQKIAYIKKLFPKLKIIAAHFGGYLHWQYVCDAYKDLEIYVDTSSSLAFISDAEIQAIRQTIPMEYILYGSDYPVYDPVAEVQLLQQRLKLSDGELEQLLTNANRLFA